MCATNPLYKEIMHTYVIHMVVNLSCHVTPNKLISKKQALHTHLNVVNLLMCVDAFAYVHVHFEL